MHKRDQRRHRSCRLGRDKPPKPGPSPQSGRPPRATSRAAPSLVSAAYIHPATSVVPTSRSAGGAPPARSVGSGGLSRKVSASGHQPPSHAQCSPAAGGGNAADAAAAATAAAAPAPVAPPAAAAAVAASPAAPVAAA